MGRNRACVERTKNMASDDNAKARLIDALKKLDTVIVTTKADNGTMHARPMAIAEIGASCDLKEHAKVPM